MSKAEAVSPVRTVTGDGLAIYQVTEINPAHAPTFDQWKDHVAQDYKQEQVPTMMEQRLNKLSERAKQLGDLKKAAVELKLTTKTSDLVGRDGNVPDLGVMGQAASAAFSLPKGGVSAPITTGRNRAVLQVVDKQEPSADEIAQNFSKQRTQLLERKKDDLFGVYMGTVLDRYKNKGGIRILEQPKKGAPGGQNPLGF